MQNKYKTIMSILLYVIAGAGASIIIGFISLGPRIFIYTLPAFHFILVGIAGAIIFATVRFYNKWTAALAVLILAFILMIILKILKIPQFVFQIIWAIASGYLIFAMACLYRTKLGKLPIGKFLIVGIALAILYVALAYGRLMMLGMPATYLSLRPSAILGFLIGCGLGVGIEVGELLSRLFLKKSLTPAD